MVEGVPCPLTVTVQFNAGVYMTAIRPVLDKIDENWISYVGDWSISCSEISNRAEMSDHLVCTKLSLKVTNKESAD